MPVLHLPSAVRTMLVGMARAGLPNEVCGFLSGPTVIDWNHDGEIAASAVWPVTNALASSVAFALDGSEMLATEDRIERDGETVLGVVHSHPTSEARPSRRDIADASTYDPESALLQVIVSMQGFAPTIRAWRMPVGVAGVVIEVQQVSGDLRFS